MSLCDGEMVNIGASLYTAACWANSRCKSNAAIVFDGRNAAMRVISDIREGEQIFISYTVNTAPRQIRQKQCKTQYFFECDCQICTAEFDPLANGIDGKIKHVVLEKSLLDDNAIGATYLKYTKQLAPTHAAVFEIREAYVAYLLKTQQYSVMIPVLQKSTEALTELFGPLHPLISVNHGLIFKAAIFFENDLDLIMKYGTLASKTGNNCVSSLVATHGTSHYLYLEAMEAFRMYQQEVRQEQDQSQSPL
jgi:hypothetical protein